ncbi:MAG TPA: MFS transporter [Mycobacteriales bacterium]|nr:MFS transporter [Mycobacteriales bacterium]
MSERPASYREVLAVGEFRALFGAHVASLLGDQAAKVALAILVLTRSDSPLLAALAYAVGYLPWIVGGPVLSPLADRRPRRDVMVRCDLVRAVAVAAMAVPGTPLWLLFALLLGSSLLMPPFEAARAATLPDVLTGDRYVVASSLSSITNQLCQVAGFVLGGAAVVALSPRGALLADAASFALSAALIAGGVKWRPAADREGRPTLRADLVEGARVVFRSPVLRSILLLAWFGAAFAVVPEGLAVTYARRLGWGPLATGLLTAASPAGLVAGALLIGRLTAPRTRLRLMLPLAAFAFVPLVLTAAHPPLWAAALLWAASGFGTAYQLPANATFMLAVPPEARGRAFGLAQSGIQALQGVALAGGGALALALEPHVVVAIAGLAGLAAVGLLTLTWPHGELAALHAPAPEDESLGDMTFGDVPLEPPVPVLPELALQRWMGPYQLRPRPRTLLVRLVRDRSATPDSSARR